MTRLTKTSLLLTVFFALDKGLAILRQMIIARQFGLSSELDAFNAANNLPDLLYALISGGALAIAFIPVLSETLTQKDRAEVWELFSKIANLAFLVTGAFAIVIAFLAKPLVGWELGIAPGFGEEQQLLVAELMRLNLIATMIFSLSGLVMAGLQANQHFLLPAMSPLLYNVGQIFGAVILAPETGYQIGPVSLPGFGMGVHGLLYGVIIGALLHFGIQIPGLIRYQFHWTPKFDLNSPDVIRVLRLLVPRILSMLFIQYIFLARDNMASRLETGAVTALTYGWMIMQVPETLIGTAIGTALLPTISEHFARRDWEAFAKTIERAVQVLLALTIPVAVLLSIGIGPLIGAAFDFGETGNELVTWVTRMYLLGVIGHSLLEVAARAFYAQQDARIPLLGSALNAIAYTALGFLMIQPLGAVGISLANTLAYTGEAVLLLVLLNHRLPVKLEIGSGPWRAALGAIVGGVVVAALMRWLPLPLLYATFAALAAGGVAILPSIWKELRVLVRL